MQVVKKLLLVLLLVGVLLATNLLPSYAQEEREGIGISPTTLQLQVNPGEVKEGQFTVLNSGTSTLRYRVYVNDFGIINEDYERDFETQKSENSIISWFSVPGGYHDLAAGAQTKIKYTLTIPQDAVPQGYYAVIFAETAEPETAETGVARLKRVGSLTYLTVKGGSIEKGQFLGFESGLWQRDRNFKTSIRIQNSGNVHFDATGEVRLKNILGRTVNSRSFNGTLLPQTIRKFSPELSTSLPLGIYRVDGELKFLDQTIKLGGNWILVASPLWLAIFLLVVAVWVVVIILWVKRRRTRRHGRRRR